MIIIPGNESSNYYANYCIPSWDDYGFRVEKFNAETPETICDRTDLKFARYNRSQKYFAYKLQVEITQTERACWYSHYMLWKKCIDLDRPIMILEHDAYFYKPENFWIDLDNYELIFYDKAAMGCYIITPSAAKTLVNYVTNNIISTGVLAGIHECYSRNKFKRKVHAHFTASIIPCVNQVYSSRYRNTIHHPSDDYPDIKWKQHEFIRID
jgi:GR25 family glycosyltransferase involved in LPS biosynthesis